MADLIHFPTARRSSRAISPYRAYRFGPNGSVRATLPIEAETDAQAEQHARALSDGHRIELWSRARFVSHIAPLGAPIAVSLRLLGDRDVP